jgi:hypothetical protein
MPRAVVLLHELPDGTSHYDLFVEDLCIVGEHRLLAWRVNGVPDRAGRWRGERIGLHRAVYLDFEGDIGANRGRVRRVLRGEVLDLETGDGSVRLAVRWVGLPDRVWTILGRLVGGGESDWPEAWEFEVVENQDSRDG